MPRLEYALVPERPSDTPIFRKGWRPIKLMPCARLAADVGAAAVLAARRRLDENVRPSRGPAPTPQEPVVIMDVDSASWAHNLKIPAWNIDYPDTARRHPVISADMPKARSGWGGWGTAFPSSVLENTPASHRELKAPEVSAKQVNSTPSNLREAEESRLPASIRRPVITADMASSLKAKLEDMPPPAGIAKAAAAVDFLAPVLITALHATSLNWPIENVQPTLLSLQALSDSQTVRMTSRGRLR